MLLFYIILFFFGSFSQKKKTKQNKNDSIIPLQYVHIGLAPILVGNIKQYYFKGHVHSGPSATSHKAEKKNHIIPQPQHVSK